MNCKLYNLERGRATLAPFLTGKFMLIEWFKVEASG
jgi:hypothetical protein